MCNSSQKAKLRGVKFNCRAIPIFIYYGVNINFSVSSLDFFKLNGDKIKSAFYD